MKTRSLFWLYFLLFAKLTLSADYYGLELSRRQVEALGEAEPHLEAANLKRTPLRLFPAPPYFFAGLEARFVFSFGYKKNGQIFAINTTHDYKLKEQIVLRSKDKSIFFPVIAAKNVAIEFLEPTTLTKIRKDLVLLRQNNFSNVFFDATNNILTIEFETMCEFIFDREWSNGVKINKLVTLK